MTSSKGPSGNKLTGEGAISDTGGNEDDIKRRKVRPDAQEPELGRRAMVNILWVRAALWSRANQRNHASGLSCSVLTLGEEKDEAFGENQKCGD